MCGDCQAGGEAGGFDAEQVDQSYDAMGLRSPDQKIFRRGR